MNGNGLSRCLRSTLAALALAAWAAGAAGAAVGGEGEAVETVASQPAWVIRSSTVEAAVTQLGAHMAPVKFCCDSGAPVQPYHISPWQDERLSLDPPVLAPLRGDFFCLPFGGNGAPYLGQKFLPHGEPAGAKWTFAGLDKSQGVTALTLTLKTNTPAGMISKKVCLVDGQNVVYSQEVLQGYSGQFSIGHHAILAVPEKEGSLRIATSKIRFGMTSPVLFSNPVNREYQSFAIGKKFSDLRHVPLQWKDAEDADCTSFPARTGFADLLGVFSEPAEKLDHGIAWTTATNQDAGYLWFSMRDPRVLPTTVFWIENHGRHGSPWNGRNRCLGLEDVCSYLNEGMPVSAQPNSVNKEGIPTALELSPDRPTTVNYIQGVVKIPPGFTVVKTVEFGAGAVTFVSAAGQKATAAVHYEFLGSGKLWGK